MTGREGSLTAVGIGIRSPAQATFEAASLIQGADKVFILLPDPIAHYWVRTLNKNAESLAYCYAEGKDRAETYREIVARIVTAVRDGGKVCAVSYGHPGIAAFPFHEAVRVLRADGYRAEMFAGISAIDCLVAELGIDPMDGGCLSYEATDFLLHRRPVDPACNLILWQIGVIAEPTYKQQAEAWNRGGLLALVDRLLEYYADKHEVIVYETSSVPICEPMVVRVPLNSLSSARVTAMSTLFVPPMIKAPLDEAMARRLALTRRS